MQSLREDSHTGPDLLGFLRIVRDIDRRFALAIDRTTGRRTRAYQLALKYHDSSFTLRVSASEASAHGPDDFTEVLGALANAQMTSPRISCVVDEPGVTSVTLPLGAASPCCFINS